MVNKPSSEVVKFMRGLWALVFGMPLKNDGRTGGLRVYDGFVSARFQTKQVVVSSKQHELLSKLVPACGNWVALPLFCKSGLLVGS